MTLVAGVDSSTQACKVVVCDADTGTVVREGRAAHPGGTEVWPTAWDHATHEALRAAGGLDDVAAVAVGGQQHGMVCLDERGSLIRPALLWNDVRSAGAASRLVDELGGPAVGAQAWASAVGSVPVAALTVTKLRWLAEHEPQNAARVAGVCLPHDWLTWRLRGSSELDDLVTDRGDASGTGYWSPATGDYRHDILRLALGHDAAVPRVLGRSEPAGATPGGVLLGPGSGDNAAAALGLDAAPGDVVVSVGTSGVVCGRSAVASADPTGIVAGFAAATGDYLPLVCTLNAARVLDAAATLLRVDHGTLADLALEAPAGSAGVVLLPYFEGERTPGRPTATASVHGMRLATTTPAHLARAAVEGLLCGLADGLDPLAVAGVAPSRVLLIGGGARSRAVREIAPTVFGVPVLVPAAGEYVALGAARQAAWALHGSAEPPPWSGIGVQRYDDGSAPEGAGAVRPMAGCGAVTDTSTRPDEGTLRMQTTSPWLEVEIVLTAQVDHAAPYRDVDVWADFRCGSDELRRPAFWDGDEVWRVRFAAPYEGDWAWLSDADTDDPGLRGQRGTVHCRSGEATGHAFFDHGFWGMSPGGRNLVHADGTPALLVADTAWALPWRATPEQVEVYAADRRAKGFNAVLLMSVQPDMHAVGPRDRTQDEGFDVGFEDLAQGHLTELNPGYFRTVDRLLDILVAHELVPVLQPVFQGFGWKGLDVAGRVVPPAEYARFCRYLVARYGARPTSYLVGADSPGTEPQVEAGGRRGARLGRVCPADRGALPAACDQPRPPGRRLAGLPVVPDRPRRRARRRAVGGHVA